MPSRRRQIAGPIAIFSWAIGAVMILLIALTYAELGVMFPLSGGVIRFPHLSFGSFASFTMGWVNWIAAAAVAPIEVEGALQYATKYAPFTAAHQVNGETVHTLTGLGYGVAVVAMAFFVVVNYYGVRWFARVNNVAVWWKLAVIITVVLAFLLTEFHSANFSSHGFSTDGHARDADRHRDRRHHLLLPRLPAGHRTRRRIEQPEAQRADRRHRLGADHRPDLRGAADRLHRRRARLRPAERLVQPRTSRTSSGRSPRLRRSSDWAGSR